MNIYFSFSFHEYILSFPNEYIFFNLEITKVGYNWILQHTTLNESV